MRRQHDTIRHNRAFNRILQNHYLVLDPINHSCEFLIFVFLAYQPLWFFSHFRIFWSFSCSFSRIFAYFRLNFVFLHAFFSHFRIFALSTPVLLFRFLSIFISFSCDDATIRWKLNIEIAKQLRSSWAKRNCIWLK